MKEDTKSQSDSPEMVSTVFGAAAVKNHRPPEIFSAVPKKTVRFDGRPPQDMAAVHNQKLGRSLRRMKRRLFLDAVADVVTSTTEQPSLKPAPPANANEAPQRHLNREDDESDTTSDDAIQGERETTLRMVNYHFVAPCGFDTSSESFSDDQVE